jgi:hypothetical protein
MSAEQRARAIEHLADASHIEQLRHYVSAILLSQIFLQEVRF